METYGKILTFVTPFFFLFVFLEKCYGWYVKKYPFKSMDMIAGLTSGFTNSLKDVLGLSITIISYAWLVDKVAIYHIKTTWVVYVVAFIAMDFAGYWFHRMSHEINFFWNRHVVHHSSEEFDLACALRQSISGFINTFMFFLLPAAFLGISAEVIAIIAPIQLFAQFWYHTVYINKMGFLEKILVTPSHHRVHHARNHEYIDKNLGQVFIIWDKLFGTFQEELPDVKIVYGITRPARTWNPFKINFQHLALLISDAYRTENWKDKLTIWFKPTGWRPEDVAKKYPVYKIENQYEYQNYETPASFPFRVFIWFQFFATYAVLYYLFGHITQIGVPSVFYLGAFIFLSIYAYTDLMDRNQNAYLWEIGKNIFGIFVLFYTNLSAIIANPAVIYGVVAYLLISSIASLYFSKFEIQQSNSMNIA